MNDDKETQITIKVPVPIAARVLTRAIEQYDDFDKLDTGWTIESDVLANPAESLHTELEAFLFRSYAVFADEELAARVLAALQSEEEGE